jgi:glycosyltransferase involved in cell wall biosynthesis
MKISIVIPFHNEEEIVQKTIGLVKNAMGKKYDYEIIAVDDNSDDTTGKLLDSMAKKSRQVKVMHKKNNFRGPSGLGAALIFGFKQATGDAVVTFMGDLSDDPEDIPKLIKKFEQGYDIVCGSRFVRGGRTYNYPKIKMMSNRLWNRIFGAIFLTNLRDISNGFKLYRREVLQAAKPSARGFEITAEIVLKGIVNKFKIVEVPVAWRNRKKGAGESKFGSFSFAFVITKLPKIGWAYGRLALGIWKQFLAKRVLRI